MQNFKTNRRAKEEMKMLSNKIKDISWNLQGGRAVE